MRNTDHIEAIESSESGSPFRTVDVFGLPFVACGDESAVARSLARRAPRFRPEGSRLPLVVTPNVDIMVQLEKSPDPRVRHAFAEAEYVLPDGWPIVRVSRMMGQPLSGRIAGSTVFAEWWPSIAEEGRRAAVLVSNAVVSEGLAAEHPDAAMMVAPRIGVDPDDIGAVADDFVKAAVEVEAEFVVFGIGHPKDTLLATAMLDRWPSDLPEPLCLCLGGSAELYLGLRKRAPQWVQRLGAEWLYRFLQEPRRMFRRYFVRDIAFLPMARREIRSARR